MKSSPKLKGSKIGNILASRREEIIEKQYYEIKQLESKYRKLYEGSPVMCRTIDTAGIIIDCNQAYFDNLGYSSKQEVIGHSIFEHTPPEAISIKRESFDQWRQTGMVKNKEVWLKRKDDSTFPALINANNLYDEDGNLVSSNTVITDLTESYRARKQLEKANERLKTLQEMTEQFIKVAAHELRTPIQPILLYAQLAKSGHMNQEEAWDGVIAEANRLKKLADDILDVTRIESGNFAYNFEESSINEIINQVAASARLLTGHTNNGENNVVVETKLNTDIVLSIDKNRLAQALTNIVNNSLKFTNKGRITIETCILRDKKLFEIRVRDSGSGIAPEILPKLFGKFVTKTSGNDADKHGTGLGLFITKAIIKAHHGDIFAYNNEDGPGATFLIRFPIEGTM
jgi:PAS domain S-box-containing protein